MAEPNSEGRTDNNTLRTSTAQLTEQEKQDLGTLKNMGGELLRFLDSLGSSRELSNAKTRIEEAVMWGVKHITR